MNEHMFENKRMDLDMSNVSNPRLRGNRTPLENQPLEEEERKLIINHKYHVKWKLTQGGFAKIYIGKNLETKDDIIIKVNAENDMNDKEFDIMSQLSGIKGFPMVYDSGLYMNQPYIVLEKLGLNLNQLLKKNKKHFSLKCIVSLGISLLNLLEIIHDLGWVHCDIRPDNIMIGNYKKDLKNLEIINLIDFGLSSKYLDEEDKHIEMKKGQPFKGNILFSSKNAFAGLTLSRRDDVISVVYLLIYLVDSKIPWIRNDKPVVDQFEDIGKFKNEKQPEHFVTNKSKLMQPLLQIAHNIEFNERPDYNKMKFMLNKLQLERDYLPDQKFDWGLRAGEQFLKINPLDKHSSISSCGVSSGQFEDLHRSDERQKHMFNYSAVNQQGFPLLRGAHPGSHGESYQIPRSFIQVGEYQYMPGDCLEAEKKNEILMNQYQQNIGSDEEVKLDQMTDEQKDAMIRQQIQLIKNQQMIIEQLKNRPNYHPYPVPCNQGSFLGNSLANRHSSLMMNPIDISRLNNRVSGVIPRTSFFDPQVIMGIQGGLPVNGVKSILGSRGQSPKSSSLLNQIFFNRGKALSSGKISRKSVKEKKLDEENESSIEGEQCPEENFEVNPVFIQQIQEINEDLEESKVQALPQRQNSFQPIKSSNNPSSQSGLLINSSLRESSFASAGVIQRRSSGVRQNDINKFAQQQKRRSEYLLGYN